MKIGILTFHNAHNYGAVLQVYALKKALEQLGHEAMVVDYRNDIIEGQYPYQRKISLSGIKNKIKFPMNCLKYLYANKQYHEKWNKFNEWILNYVVGNSSNCSKEQLAQLGVDMFICGSDQIWNPGLTGGFDGVYFADFSTKAKKVTYAASMGLNELPKEQEKQFISYLNNFDSISVREQSLKEYIEKISDIRTDIVVDPTLLLEAEVYEDLIVKMQLPEKYMLVYCLMDNEEMLKSAYTYAEKKGLKVVEFRYFKNIKHIGKIQVANAGPGEFLGLIKNAELILTNSFHGTVFSILFQKKFFTVALGAVSSRMESLLQLVGLTERYISNGQYEKIDIDKQIDYVKVKERIQEEKKKSYLYLKKLF